MAVIFFSGSIVTVPISNFIKNGFALNANPTLRFLVLCFAYFILSMFRHSGKLSMHIDFACDDPTCRKKNDSFAVSIMPDVKQENFTHSEPMPTRSREQLFLLQSGKESAVQTLTRNTV